MMSTMLMQLIRPAPTSNGRFCVIEACNTQKPLPETEMISMDIDTSSVCLVCMALIICGTRISVQRNEAAHPNKTSNGIVGSILRSAYRWTRLERRFFSRSSSFMWRCSRLISLTSEPRCCSPRAFASCIWRSRSAKRFFCWLDFLS